MPRKPTGFERMLDESLVLRKQIEWLCESIPKIGRGGSASGCPSEGIAKECPYAASRPGQVCSECWRNASREAAEAETKIH